MIWPGDGEKQAWNFWELGAIFQQIFFKKKFKKNHLTDLAPKKKKKCAERKEIMRQFVFSFRSAHIVQTCAQRAKPTKPPKTGVV